MTINLDSALEKDYVEYKKQLAAYENEKRLVDKKIIALFEEYRRVLILVGDPRTKPVRARRGQSRELIVGTFEFFKRPLKAFEIMDGIASMGKNLSAASVRQQLPLLVKNGVLKKNKDKTYELKKKKHRKLTKEQIMKAGMIGTS